MTADAPDLHALRDRVAGRAKVSLVRGNLSGVLAIYINDQRVTGRHTKPLGGGTTEAEWSVDAKDILDALLSQAATAREEG